VGRSRNPSEVLTSFDRVCHVPFIAAPRRAHVSGAEADLSQATAQLQSVCVAVTDAEQKQTRAAALAARQLETDADMDAANIAVDTNRAAVRSAAAVEAAAKGIVREARAAFDQALVNLEHCTISAPMDGIVIQRAVDVGQTVAASVQALVLFAIAADLRRMQIEVDLDESDVGGIQPGELATFRCRVDDSGSGAVRQVWRYDGRRFAPVTITTGLTDSQWTELLGPGVHVGEPLVTSAAVSGAPRTVGRV
jgi:HlyD family secretion protein